MMKGKKRKKNTKEVIKISIEELAFWKYLIFDEEEGGAIGIQEDTPEEIKKEYEKFLEIRNTEKL